MSAKTATSTSEANKAIVQRIFAEAWNEANVDEIATHIASDLKFNFRGSTRNTDAQALKRLIDKWHRAFSDLRFRVHEIVAERDVVAVRLTFTGTHIGEWKEIRPTGRSIEVTQMMFFRVQDGRVVEAWEDYDEYGMRWQLGALD